MDSPPWTSGCSPADLAVIRQSAEDCSPAKWWAAVAVGQIERHRLTGEAPEAEMRVESGGCVVLGVNHQRKYRRLGGRRAGNRVDDEGAAKPAPAKLLINGETADQAGRQQGIARQPLRLVGRQFGKGDAGRGEGVVARDGSGEVGSPSAARTRLAQASLLPKGR